MSLWPLILANRKFIFIVDGTVFADIQTCKRLFLGAGYVTLAESVIQEMGNK
jgi:hypothetical protein